jgi:hypothetical protein
MVKKPGIWLAVILGAGLALRLPGILEPWGSDQSVFAFIGEGMLHGRVPYRDLYSSTGYGIFFTYAGLLALFGGRMISLHAGDLAASLAAILIVREAARRLAGERAGLMAAALQAVFGAGIGFSALYEMGEAAGPYWSFAQRESFMGPLLAGALVLALPRAGAGPRTPGGRARWMIIGALVGLAAIFKMTAAPFFLLFAAAPLLEPKTVPLEDRFSRSVRCALFALAGFALVQLPFVAYFAANGSLGTMLQAVFIQTSEYAKLSRGSRLETFTYAHGALFAEQLPVWILAALAAAGIAKRRDRGGLLLTLAAGVAALVSVWVQGKFFGYHFLVVFPFLCILAGVAWERERGGLRPPAAPQGARFLLPALLAVWAGCFLSLNYPHLRWDLMRMAGALDEDAHAERFNEYPEHFYSYRSDREVAAYLREHAPPGASLRLVNDGGELLIFHLAPLTSPTRFTSSWYLFNQSLLEQPGTAALRAEFIDETMRARPDYLLLVFYPLADWPKLYPLDSDAKLRQFYGFIRDGYELEKSFRDGRDLYRRID